MLGMRTHHIFCFMSQMKNYLHSHSALERELKIPKRKVLVDTEYGELFPTKVPFHYNKVDYFMVDTYTFFRRGGVFKNLLK